MSPLADPPQTVLIVSNDPIGAALLGALVETFGYRVTFAGVSDSSEHLRRVRPHVCMLDCASDACGEAAIARAIMRGVSVVLVGPRSLLADLRDTAARHGAEMLFTPPEPGPLGDLLDRAARRSSA
jgi:CheY-like chemotaxis protein